MAVNEVVRIRKETVMTFTIPALAWKGLGIITVNLPARHIAYVLKGGTWFGVR
jgi:hypothetical protein